MKSKDLIDAARRLGYRVEVADSGNRFSVEVNRRTLSFAWDRGNYCDVKFAGDPADAELVEIYNYVPRSNPAGWVPADYAYEMLRLLAPRRRQRGA